MGILFEKKQIVFNRYEFKTSSSLRQNNAIQIKTINEVILETHPLSIIINKNEILFVPENQRKDLMKIVHENQITISKRYDIWQGLMEPFLETPPSSSEQNETHQKLLNNGLTHNEVLDIRERLKKVMQGWASICWNRNYLGQYDLLLNKKEIYALHFPHNFYWWTMKIALRNL